MNADLTNPIVYNGIGESLKEEHVYDEIKQKEGYKDPGRCFRLPFRASNSINMLYFLFAMHAHIC